MYCVREQQTLDYRTAAEKSPDYDSRPPWSSETAAATVATVATLPVSGFEQAALEYCRGLAEPGEALNLTAEHCAGLCREFIAEGSLRILPSGKFELVKQASAAQVGHKSTSYLMPSLAPAAGFRPSERSTIHEAAHAIVARMHNIRIDKVSVIEGGGAYVRVNLDDALNGRYGTLITCAAGGQAECQLIGQGHYAPFSDSDIEMCHSVLDRMGKSRWEHHGWIDSAKVDAARLVHRHSSAIRKLASKLSEVGLMDAIALDSFLAGLFPNGLPAMAA